jgi:3-oxoacid CoA-transferase
MLNKVFSTFDEAVADIPDGASIAIDSWGVAGTPQNLIAAINRKGIKDLTIITHAFVPQYLDELCFPAVLLPQMKKLITPVVGFAAGGAGAFVKEYVEKGLEVEVSSHGTLASRLYAGAAGLGGFYNPVGVGTVLEEEKEKRVIDGREYIFEEAVRPDYAFIRGCKADKLGNLVYRGVYRLDHPVMAMAASVTIAEVDEIVEIGEIDPEHVVTPGIFVDRIIEIPEEGLGTARKGKELMAKVSEIAMGRKMMFREAGIEQRLDLAEMKDRGIRQRLDRETMAMRAAKELKNGDYVNLGMGIPGLCALHMPEGVIFQTENGALGYGLLVMEDEIEKADFHYVDAGGRFFRKAPGMALFDIIASFVMIRSGRLTSIMGALQVSEKGDLANWNPGGGTLGGTIGGGMDLAWGAKKVIIAMEHTTKDGKPKIVKECTYHLTAKECVDLIVTDLSVIQVTPEGLLLREVAPGWTVEEVQALTEPKLSVASDLKEIEL